ncbi:Anti-sigma-K factor RskA [Cohaesibacter sp. ES.047]|uniref:anti-sigma factor n=1 Tax=Cohaesibacter sp. ES.047 TaxID=1798205 RepID=UPI000BB83ACE|nr:anti-sigma factor [Cohaesibacter sp. ES.047]SNY90906.1 Anti-sigma-K factor RskA [Cohaesibacter sp. ES.047]
MTAQEKKDRDDRLLAAEYALGVLPHDERQVFSARLERETDLRQEVAFWDAHYEPLSDLIEPVTPPATLYAKIEEQLFDSSSEKKAGLWSSLGFWRGLTFASLIGFALMTSVLVVTLRMPDAPGPSYVAELSGDAGAVRLVALYEEQTGQLRLNRTQGVAAPERDFELWLIAGENAPVSLGVLPEETQAVLTVPESLKAKLPGSVLAISDEPAGGSPTGEVTGPVLATGNVSVI